MPGDLASKVKAVNKANAYANQVHDILTEVFRPFVGQKIIKVDGDLMARVKDYVPPLQYDAGLRCWKKHSDYSLSWGVDANISYGNGCEYSGEVVVYIGRLEGQTLVELTPNEKRRTDWTVEEVREKRKAYEELKAAADSAFNAISPFGLY